MRFETNALKALQVMAKGLKENEFAYRQNLPKAKRISADLYLKYTNRKINLEPDEFHAITSILGYKSFPSNEINAPTGYSAPNKFQ